MNHDEASSDRWVALSALCRGPWSISFQRFELPERQWILDAPSSLGALTIASFGVELLLPLAEHEGFWIGIEAHSSSPAVEADLLVLGDDGVANVIKLNVTPPLAIAPGLPCSSGYICFSRETVKQLEVRIGEQFDRLQIVDPLTYTSSTGLPPPAPLEPSAGYLGWLLP